MKFGVIIFPGSNCDRDTVSALENISGSSVEIIWHKATALPKVDCIVLPGGFSYGDYLRAGAIARFSPVMQAVVEYANSGGSVVGICNGFQILMEAGLLPGAMLVNRHLRFISKMSIMKVVNHTTKYTNQYHENQVIRMPIAHYEGNYYTDPETLERLKSENRIVFRYCDESGDCTDEANPNGALFNIAGIINSGGNVLGMMPHFERAAESILGSADGKHLILSIMESLNDK